MNALSPLLESWDRESMDDYKRWSKNAAPPEKKKCTELWADYDFSMVEEEGQGFDKNDTNYVRYASSLDNVDVCIYRAEASSGFCVFAGIAEQERKCHLVLIGKCSEQHQWSTATRRIEQWQVR